jgi:hypothetical protein
MCYVRHRKCDIKKEYLGCYKESSSSKKRLLKDDEEPQAASD